MTSSRQVARVATMSGRSCSLACRVFFPPQAGTPQRPADHWRAEPPADPLGQHARVFGQCRIRPLSHQGRQHAQIRPAQQGLTAAAAQRGAPALPRLPQPVIHRADRHLEPLGQDTLATLAPLMRPKYALSQVCR